MEDATTATASDVLSENTNSLNSIFKFEQYSISDFFKFMQTCTFQISKFCYTIY